MKLKFIILLSSIVTLLLTFVIVLISNAQSNKVQQIKPEYIIELVNQDDIAINNGIVTDTIKLEEIPMWIELDNL